MNTSTYTLNSFTKDEKWWNPAGVVLDSSELSSNQMQIIAKKIGMSETAFVERWDNTDFKLRFFTPNSEVDLCGHATIAAFYLMWKQNLIKSIEYTQETIAWILKINIEDTWYIFMEQKLPKFLELINREKIANSLNISVDDLVEELPIQIVSTGLKDVLIAVKNRAILDQIKPDFAEITKISKQYDIVWYHLFSLEDNWGVTAYCRNFAPLYDIPEESATWTSNGALACYLYHYGLIDWWHMLKFLQGYSMGQLSEVVAKLHLNDSRIAGVHVWGTGNNIQILNLQE